jgi:lipase
MKSKEPSIRSVNIGDTSIEYLDYRGGEKTILFLHATGFLPWIWHPIARGFAGEYRVIAPYFCDHRNAHHEEGVDWMILADDLCTMCERLEIRNPLLVGHSMGATVCAIAQATRTISEEKMVLIEPIFLPEQVYEIDVTVDQHPLAAKALRRKNHWNDREEARQYLRSKPLFARWDDEMLELYLTYGIVSGEAGGLTLACPPTKEAALFMGSVRFNPWPLLSRIHCPTLVLEGEQSENRQFIDLPKLTSLIPCGQYSMVRGAGHLIPMERPVETADIIREFLV